MIGQTGTTRVKRRGDDWLTIQVRIVEVIEAYGRTDYRVEPVSGSGTIRIAELAFVPDGEPNP
jgi:hypothetical protein